MNLAESTSNFRGTSQGDCILWIHNQEQYKARIKQKQSKHIYMYSENDAVNEIKKILFERTVDGGEWEPGRGFPRLQMNNILQPNTTVHKPHKSLTTWKAFQMVL